ncbi:MAG: Ig-like domain-containing protein, partial [Firmicutes bacterium]|nr:Ig-like domain-containing protein [Bacillota bacterium]
MCVKSLAKHVNPRSTVLLFAVLFAIALFFHPAASWADAAGVYFSYTSQPSGAIVSPGTTLYFSAQAYGGNGIYQYNYWLGNLTTGTWTCSSPPWSSSSSYSWYLGSPGQYQVVVYAKDSTNTTDTGRVFASVYYTVQQQRVGVVTISASPSSPQNVGTPVTFCAQAYGSSSPQYQWWVNYPNGTGNMVQNWSSNNSYTLSGYVTRSYGYGTYTVTVNAKDASAGSTQASNYMSYVFNSSAYVTSLIVSPSSVNLSVSSQQQLWVTARYSDYTQKDVTSSATYTSNNSSVASVDSSGVVRGAGAGSATISVYFGGQSAQVPVTVSSNSGTVTSVTLSPSSTTAGVGSYITFTATAYGSSSNVQYQFLTDRGCTGNLTVAKTWSSSNTFSLTDSTPINYYVVVQAKDASAGTVQA